MKWFYENELPKITDIESLESAMGAVKARFNGHPQKFTRNDYLLLINTLYAALTASYEKSNQAISAELTSDIDPNYPLEVGYVNDDTPVFTKGTRLEDILRSILEGDYNLQILQSPNMTYTGGDLDNNVIIFDQYVNVTLTNPDNIESDIYYSLSDDHGWRIYNSTFLIKKDTELVYKRVPNYKSGYKYCESDSNNIAFKKHIIRKLSDPYISVTPGYDKCIISITHNNGNNGKIQYFLDNKWVDYTDEIEFYDGVQKPIKARVLSLNTYDFSNSNEVPANISYLEIPNPIVSLYDYLNNSKSVSINNKSFDYYGYCNIKEATVNLLSLYVILYNDTEEAPLNVQDSKLHICTSVLMADGKTERRSSGFDLVLNRKYLSLNKPIITGTNNFINSSIIEVSKNQGSYSDFVDINWTVNGNVQSGLTTTITEKSTIVATVIVKENYKLLYNNYSSLETKIFDKLNIITKSIETNLLIPEDLNYYILDTNNVSDQNLTLGTPFNMLYTEDESGFSLFNLINNIDITSINEILLCIPNTNSFDLIYDLYINDLSNIELIIICNSTVKDWPELVEDNQKILSLFEINNNKYVLNTSKLQTVNQLYLDGYDIVVKIKFK